MTVSSALPPISSDPLFASEKSPSDNPVARSPSLHSFLLPKLRTFCEPIVTQIRSWMPALALCTALCGMSCASIFVVIAEQELSPLATVFNRLLIATIAFGAWHMLQRSASCAQANAQTDSTFLAETNQIEANQIETNQQIPSSLDLALLFLAGICFAASLSLAAWSLTQTSVANSALLNNMMPIFTTLGAWVFLAQRFSRKFLLGLLVAIVGVCIIGLQDLHPTSSQIPGDAISGDLVSGNHMIGDAAALLAAVLLAVTILSLEQLRTKFPTPTLMMGISLTGSLVVLPILILSQSRLFPTSWVSGLAVLALALIAQVIGHGLLTYSLKQFSSGLVAVSMLAIPMIATVLAMVLFAQPLSLLNSVAFLIVLMGIYLAVSAPKCSQEVSSEAN